MTTGVIYARVSSIGDRQSTERQVKDLSEYAKYKGMESMAATGYNVSDLYKSVVSKLIKENSNAEYRLMESYIDIECCETIYKSYPHLTKDDFISAIEKNSPRCSMPGIPENYASNLVEKYIFSQEKEIEERNLLEKNKREQTALICQDFKQNEELSYSDNNLTKYHSCRAALMMLQSGVPDSEIMAAISDTISQLGYDNDQESDIDSFAKNVLDGAHNVRDRLNSIVMHDNSNAIDMSDAGQIITVESKFPSMAATDNVLVLPKPMLSARIHFFLVKRNCTPSF